MTKRIVISTVYSWSKYPYKGSFFFSGKSVGAIGGFRHSRPRAARSVLESLPKCHEVRPPVPAGHRANAPERVGPGMYPKRTETHGGNLSRTRVGYSVPTVHVPSSPTRGTAPDTARPRDTRDTHVVQHPCSDRRTPSFFHRYRRTSCTSPSKK